MYMYMPIQKFTGDLFVYETWSRILKEKYIPV